jgi:hypothetical protein
MRAKDGPEDIDLFHVVDASILHIGPPLVVLVIRLEHRPRSPTHDVIPLQSQPRIARPLQRVSR